MMTLINWMQGQPTQAGYYLVAIKLAPAVGYFDMAIWNGQDWEFSQPERIIGYFPFDALKSQLSFSWPEYDAVEKTLENNADAEKILLTDSEKQDWEEI